MRRTNCGELFYEEPRCGLEGFWEPGSVNAKGTRRGTRRGSTHLRQKPRLVANLESTPANQEQEDASRTSAFADDEPEHDAW